MTITFVGHGYVGLVTACVFADFGNKVWVVGHTPEKLERLKNGDPIIYEPGLKELLEKNLKAKRIFFTDSYEQAIPESEIVFITVGTPPKENGEADLSVVFEVAENIGKCLKPGLTIVSCKSTVPVGTNLKVEEIINRIKPKASTVKVASCPEFLREGTGLTDTLHPDRVVIGSNSKQAIDKLMELHQSVDGKRIITDLASAELIKYTSNAMLATKISFANLISFYCEKTGADVETVLDAVGLDKRIGRVFLYPGVGYGGSCLPKDVKAIVQTGQSLDIDTSMLESVEKINLQARENFLKKILKNTQGKKVTFWGISFKPDTDDIRFAPSVYLIKSLLDHGFEISVYDPVALNNLKKQFGEQVKYFDNPYEAVKGADVLCILTEWNEFKQADLHKVESLMNRSLIIDGRNIYIPKIVKKLGFQYISTGR
jgi:UDPglucose 6-dehydrogenase